ncbi:unnamed protein product [Rotaria magnacalcarata]|uniref:Bleomycin hydrolase n=5 Tax=Rotaria magnacalcarata TaxID=392030 RepID=A0A816ZEA0_9BILA|nr:unnamed protein product [Rotaria magnacalcarata]CAF2202137.1 unnamed protein product [Rotaria magnacalcarata]CAF2250946.1 unnamed protein product [Rotaria magnacalcarata]
MEKIMKENGEKTVLSLEQLKNLQDEYKSDLKNLVAQSACSQHALSDVIVNRKKRFSTVHVFNTKLTVEGRPVTNQRASGRCWIFACLNVIRIQLMKTLKIQELELSQNYLFYYDKIERCHYFLTSMIELAKKKEPIDGRLVQYLLHELLIDGGQWDMLVNLINKYGVIPKSAFPESSSSEAAVFMNKFLRTKLRAFAQEIFDSVEQGNVNDDDLLKREAAMMKELHQIVTTCLGSPPEQITFEYYDVNKQNKKIGPISPIEFYQQVVKPVFNIDNKVCLVNDPRASNAYGRLYTVEYLGNIVGGQKTRYNNQPIRVLKQAVYDSIVADEAVWFGVDFGKHMHAKYGILDLKIFDTQLYFNSNFPCQTKASRLAYGESLMTHAMVFTGIHVEKGSSNDTNENNQSTDLQFIRYRVENSHGDDKADKGYVVMTDDWFNEYLYEVVVDKKHLSNEVLAVVEQEPICLKAWDPMGALAD